MRWISFVLVLLLACSTEEETDIAPLNTLEVPYPVRETIFAYAWNGTIIDALHKYNPDKFILTDLQEAKGMEYIKSLTTGKVYHCVFNKGDLLIIPPREQPL